MMFCIPRKPTPGPPPDDHAKRFMQAVKILLLGTGESGKTTIIKQMRILHSNGYSEQERNKLIPYIRQNVHESIYDILENMEKINPPVYISESENNSKREYVLAVGEKFPSDDLAAYYNNVKDLWTDAGVKEAFRRSNEYQLIDCAQYFLDRIDEIEKPSYRPTDQDVLFCRIKTSSVTEMEFSVSVPKIYGKFARFLMYDVGGQRGERKKWIQVFDGVQAILFILAASDFDQTLREEATKNRLEEALDVFKEIHKSRFLRTSGIIAFLNKQDILERKIKEGRKFGDYVPDYNNYENAEKDEYIRVQRYLKKKILDINRTEVRVSINNPVLGRNEDRVLKPREVYVHYTIATDTKNVKKVFDSVHQIIIDTVIKGATKINSFF